MNIIFGLFVSNLCIFFISNQICSFLFFIICTLLSDTTEYCEIFVAFQFYDCLDLNNDHKNDKDILAQRLVFAQ